MKRTVTECEFAEEMVKHSFSYAGARALFEYLSELEKDIGEEIEFDPVALRCDWWEYSSALEAAEDYGFKPGQEGDEEDQEKETREWFRNNTTVIEFDGGVIIGTF